MRWLVNVQHVTWRIYISNERRHIRLECRCWKLKNMREHLAMARTEVESSEGRQPYHNKTVVSERAKCIATMTANDERMFQIIHRGITRSNRRSGRPRHHRWCTHTRSPATGTHARFLLILVNFVAFGGCCSWLIRSVCPSFWLPPQSLSELNSGWHLFKCWAHALQQCRHNGNSSECTKKYTKMKKKKKQQRHRPRIFYHFPLGPLSF